MFLTSLLPPRTAQATSPFLTPAAAEAWDAWFRWREHGVLRDRTIDDGWRRMAQALASAEADEGPAAARFFDAFARWAVLPDPALWASALTGDRVVASPLRMTLNVGAFARCANGGGASLDLSQLEADAALALRALDDATRLVRAVGRPELALAGLGDASGLLGLRYGYAPANALFATLARTVFRAAFAESVRLARERGSNAVLEEDLRAKATARGVDATLLALADEHGLRCAPRLVVVRQPRLALLANAISDALDPPTMLGRTVVIDHPAGVRRVRADGPLARRRERESLPVDEISEADLQAARVALAPWCDAPIDAAPNENDAASATR